MEASLITVVVGELGEREVLFPTLAEGDDTSSKHVLKNLVYSFSLTVGLRMIGGAEVETGSKSRLETLVRDKASHKLLQKDLLEHMWIHWGNQ